MCTQNIKAVVGQPNVPYATSKVPKGDELILNMPYLGTLDLLLFKNVMHLPVFLGAGQVTEFFYPFLSFMSSRSPGSCINSKRKEH